jgi:hypothetical protein
MSAPLVRLLSALLSRRSPDPLVCPPHTRPARMPPHPNPHYITIRPVTPPLQCCRFAQCCSNPTVELRARHPAPFPRHRDGALEAWRRLRALDRGESPSTIANHSLKQ